MCSMAHRTAWNLGGGSVPLCMSLCPGSEYTEDFGISCQCHDATQSALLHSESPEGAGAPSSLHVAIACAANLSNSFLLRPRRAHGPEQTCSCLDKREISLPPPAAIGLPAEAMLMFVFRKWKVSEVVHCCFLKDQPGQLSPRLSDLTFSRYTGHWDAPSR